MNTIVSQLDNTIVAWMLMMNVDCWVVAWLINAVAYWNGTSKTYWGAHFSNHLCDTSSINNTYISNHTLRNLGLSLQVSRHVDALLGLHRSSEDKGKIAMRKILQHHSHFNQYTTLLWMGAESITTLVISWLEKDLLLYSWLHMILWGNFQCFILSL